MVLLNFTDSLLQLDRELFTLINSKGSIPALDWLFKILREAYTWIPLYAFVLFYILRYHKKFAWQFVFLTLITFAITDFVSASILKPMFARSRPCHDPLLQHTLRDLVGCGGKYGMPSSHASNHFGLSTFWFATITWMGNRRWWWLWLWAFLVCYAQVYVGKHFPGDILVGAILGSSVGLLVALLFRNWVIKKSAV